MNTRLANSSGHQRIPVQIEVVGVSQKIGVNVQTRNHFNAPVFLNNP